MLSLWSRGLVFLSPIKQVHVIGPGYLLVEDTLAQNSPLGKASEAEKKTGHKNTAASQDSRDVLQPHLHPFLKWLTYSIPFPLLFIVFYIGLINCVM